VTYYIGFRDDFDVKINDLIENICALERQANPSVSESFLQEIRAVGKKATHMCVFPLVFDRVLTPDASAPHYHVVSKKSRSRWAWLVNPIRRFFVEDVYRKLAQMFPETANWLTSADESVYFPKSLWSVYSSIWQNNSRWRERCDLISSLFLMNCTCITPLL